MSKYTLADVRAEYDRLDQLTGIDTSNLDLKISTRSIRRFGQCKYGTDHLPKEINITDFIFDCEGEFWSTIRHEYAHALVRIRHPEEKHGHDKVWKAACLEVGCPPERICSDQEANRLSREKKKKQKSRRKSAPRTEHPNKYKVTCLGCSSVSYYKSVCKTIRIIRGEVSGGYAQCSRCKSRKFEIEEL